jgi:Outer membrane protein beta-barrel domain
MKTLEAITVITIFINLLHVDLQAQWHVGMKSGVHFGKISDIPELDFDYKFNQGPQISLTASREIFKNFCIGADLQYIAKGYRLKVIEEDLTASGHTKFNYLELPIYSLFFIGKQKSKFYLQAGTSFGYLLSAKGVVKIDDITYKEKIELDNARRFELSILAGIGYSLNLKKGNLLFEARFLRGLTRLSKEPDLSKDENPNNIGFGFQLGYVYPLGKSHK